VASAGIGQLEYLWLAFVVYWVLAARGGDKPKEQERTSTALVANALFAVGALLLLASGLSLGLLDDRYITRGETFVEAIGWVLTAGGLAFAVWARLALGGNWSGRIEIKADQKLIRSGPYAIVRHPIYSGLIVAVAGTALYLGEWRGLAALLVFGVGFWLKAIREETLLEAEFGEDYHEYRRQTGTLMPRIRGRRVHRKQAIT
jgi:protein-S-isoprenylcysteine O-methyltransferase Ste14